MRGRETMRNASNTISGFNQVLFDSKRDTKENREIRQKIEKIYLVEFEEAIGSILNESESIFINKYLSRLRLVLSELIPRPHLEDRCIKEFLKLHDEKILEKYLNLKKSFLKIYNEYKKNPKLVEILTKFRRHCKDCPETPIHNCKSPLILMKENNEVKYIFCSGCKDVFHARGLILYCNACQVDYFSSLVNNKEEMDYQPATWDHYHCGSHLNEQMLCLKCKEGLYIRLNDNNLFCVKCKFTSDPNKIIWICGFCKKEFQSQAKIYNSQEFRNIKNTIKEALLNKVAAVPSFNKCCVNDKNTAFFHKIACKGELYLSEFKKKPILVCSKCKSIISLLGFHWTCPKCNNIFLDEDKKAQKSQVSTSETVKNTDSSSNSYGITKSHTMKNLEDDKEIKQLYVKKNIQLVTPNSNAKRDGNFNKLEYPIDDKLRARNHSVYRFTKNNSKNGNEEKNKETKLLEINEEDHEDPPLIRSKYMKNILITENELESKPGQIIKESIYNINLSKVLDNNSPRRSLNENEILKKPIIHSQTAMPLELSSQISKIIKDSNEGYNKSVNKRNLNQEVESKKEYLIMPSSVISMGQSPRRKIEITEIKPVNQYSEKMTPKMRYENKKEEEIKNIPTLEAQKHEDNYSFNVDDYKIICSIGEGSFGIIYACEHLVTKERYALKKIIVNTEEEMNTFIQEYELVKKVKHKGILNIYGMTKKVLDFSTRVLYIIMELSQSDWDREIKARFKVNNFYKESELISLMKQISEALAFMQSIGISHRDIKPQNILVFPNQVYKVADFGEAKEVKSSKKQMETLRGTELYMSPILFCALRTSNNNNVEHNAYKSDVFSLGYCILYAATLSFKILYDIRNVTNQKSIVNIIKNYLMKKYSQKFIDLVARMIDANEVIRFDFIELNEYLNLNF